MGVSLWLSVVGKRYNTDVILIIYVNKVPLSNSTIMNVVMGKLHFSHSGDQPSKVKDPVCFKMLFCKLYGQYVLLYNNLAKRLCV